MSAVTAVQDYTAAGNITYYWAGEQVQASVEVRGMGIANFRVDATLPSGTRTWAASGYVGVVISPDGTRQLSPGYDLSTAGSMTLPHIRIDSVLADSSTSVTYVGLASLNGQQLHQVHLAMALDPSVASLTTLMPELGSFDLFIDPTSFQVIRLIETIRPESNFKIALSHEIDYANYQSAGQLNIPFAISEKINGQTTWSVALTSVTFNSGLAAAIFIP